jgi:hypothetical protein
VIIAILLKVYGTTSLINVPIYKFAICSSDVCTGNQAILRITLALAVYFAFTLAISLGTIYTASYFVLQVILLAGLMTGAFFLDNHVFEVWSEIAQFLSIGFLLIQLIVLIDFAYKWNESWVAKDKKEYYVGILIVSVVMIIASLTLDGLFFKWFAKGDGCGTESFFISVTIILTVGVVLLSISGFVENGGILPAAFIMVYSTYLLYTALKNDPKAQCNSYLNPDTAAIQTSSILGLILAAASISYAAYSAGTAVTFTENEQKASAPLLEEGDSKDDVKMAEKTEEKHEAKTDNETKAEAELPDEEYQLLKKQNMIFHAMLLMASAYGAMLLANWGSVLNDQLNSFSAVGNRTMWVNIATQWVNIALFTWTLIAPKCCPGREF